MLPDELTRGQPAHRVVGVVRSKRKACPGAYLEVQMGQGGSSDVNLLCSIFAAAAACASCRRFALGTTCRLRPGPLHSRFKAKSQRE
jgi:hypothetical protein